jgi:hypothetical protein
MNMQGYHARVSCKSGRSGKEEVKLLLVWNRETSVIGAWCHFYAPPELTIYKEIHKVFLLETGTKETVYTFKNYSMKRRDTSIM